MARPSNFTPDQILDAAQKILSEDKRVTGYALATILGGGNPTSLAAKYKELSETVAQTPKFQALPSVIEDSIHGAVSNLSKTLIDTLTRTYADLKTDAEVKVEKVKELAQAEIQDISEQLNLATENEQNEKDRVKALEVQLRAAETTITALQTDVANRDGQIKTLNDAKQTLDQNILSLQGEKQRLEIENASLTKQIADAKTAVTTAQADAKAAIQKAKDGAKIEIAEARDEAKKARAEKDAALMKATAAESAYKELKSNNDKTVNDLADANKALGTLDGQFKTVVEQLKAKTEELETIKTQASVVPVQEAKHPH